MKNNDKLLIIFLICLAAFFGGSTPPFAKAALEDIPTFTLVLLRFISAAFFLLPIVIKKRELSFANFKNTLGTSILGSLNPILLFIALQFTASTVSPVIYASVPLMTAIYFGVVTKKLPNSKALLGILVGFSGVLLITLYPILFGTKDIQIDLFGNFLILLAAVAFMFYSISSKSKQATSSPLSLTFYFVIVTIILSIPLSIYELAFLQKPIEFNLSSIGATLWIGIVGTAMSYVILQEIVKKASPLTAMLFTYLQPVFTFIIAFFLLGEKITVPFIFGSVLAIIGASITSLSKDNEKNKEKSPD